MDNGGNALKGVIDVIILAHVALVVADVGVAGALTNVKDRDGGAVVALADLVNNVAAQEAFAANNEVVVGHDSRLADRAERVGWTGRVERRGVEGSKTRVRMD